VRIRIATIGLVAAVAAGCSGGHGTAPGPSRAGSSHDFAVQVQITPRDHADRFSPAPPLTILVDTATGAFRISGGPPRMHFRGLTVSDGREATQVSGLQTHPVVSVYRGSQRFVADRAGGTPLRVVEAFLAGTRQPRGVRVRVLAKGPPARLIAATATERLRITIRRTGPIPADAFRPARGTVAQVATELRAGVNPDSSVSAYWLGPDWKGTATGSGGWYTLGYPHVDVGLTGASGVTGRRSLTLADGTHATLQVVRVRPNGVVSVSSATTGGSVSSFHGYVYMSTDPPGTPVAFVFLPHATVTLSGAAVTPRSALAIAQSLRPL
jgi:hypothetical protein